MKIIVFMSGLPIGGAERVAVSLCNFLAEKDIDTYLISFDDKNPAYSISDKVNFYKNDEKYNSNRIKGFFHRISYMMNIFNTINPDLIFTMSYKMVFYSLYYKMFSKNRKVKIVSSERCNPNSKDRRGLTKILNYVSSRQCDGFIFQTERAKSLYSKKVQNRSVVIHNPISNPLISKIKNDEIRTKKIITSMGRLEEQKAQDVMIKSFANVVKKYPEYKLVIYGEGSKREYLEELIKQLNLENKVFLPGADNNAILEIAKSQIFLLTSKFEGMPNALLEAMSIGVPCISTDCEMGPSELITNEENGFLVQVGDVEGLTKNIFKLLDSKKLCDQISKESIKINQTHSVEIIFNEYLSYFQYVLHKKKNLKEKIFKALARRNLLNFLPDEIYLKIMYYSIVGKKLNLKNPQTFNEKLQWLKLYNRNEQYTLLVDKIEAKKIVAKIIGDEYIIPTIGVYENFDDIDFETLPNQFVIKCSHDSGGVIICKDKEKFNIQKAKQKIEKHLNQNFYYVGREWPYKNIRPRIIIEKYMVNTNESDLSDYKFMCFDGKVKCSFVCSERRSKTGLKVTFFDLDWNKMPFERHYPSSYQCIEKPKQYDRMIKLAEKLSKCIPFVRIDFYEIEGRIYFGEATFFPGNGTEEFTPESYDYLLGRWLVLPNVKFNKK